MKQYMKNLGKFLTKKNIFLIALVVVLLYFSGIFGNMREGNTAAQNHREEAAKLLKTNRTRAIEIVNDILIKLYNPAPMVRAGLLSKLYNNIEKVTINASDVNAKNAQNMKDAIKISFNDLKTHYLKTLQSLSELNDLVTKNQINNLKPKVMEVRRNINVIQNKANNLKTQINELAKIVSGSEVIVVNHNMDEIIDNLKLLYKPTHNYDKTFKMNMPTPMQILDNVFEF